MATLTAGTGTECQFATLADAVKPSFLLDFYITH